MKIRSLFVLSLAFINSIAMAQERPKLIWAKGVAGSEQDIIRGVAVDATGATVTMGYLRATGDYDPGPGVSNLTHTAANGTDLFVYKLDKDGNFVWAKSVAPAVSGSSDIFGDAVAVDASGNVLITGLFYNTIDFDPGPGVANLTSAGSFDVFVLKLSGNGDYVWAKSFRGSFQERGSKITTDASGNVYTVGAFQGTTDFDPNAGTFNIVSSLLDVFVSKLDANGNFVWAKAMGGTLYEYPSGIYVDAATNIYTSGYFQGTADFDPGAAAFNLTTNSATATFISKLDVNGNFVWAKGIGNTAGTDARSTAITGNSSGIYTTGVFTVPTDFDPGAGVVTLTPAGDQETFIVKLDAAGNFVWAKGFGTDSADGSTDISSDPSGNIYTVGMFQNSGDFDPGPGVATLTANASNAAYIVKLTSSGNFVWATRIGTGYIPALYIQASSSGNMYMSGSFSAAVDLDPGACASTLSSGFVYTERFALDTDPSITSFNPTSGLPGTAVTITGNNFSLTPSENVVTFNSTTAVVTASTLTTISTTVPTGAVTGKISVTVRCVTVSSATDFTVPGTVPSTLSITGFTPSSGIVGTTVIITGTNFSATAANNVVKFNGSTATVTSSTATSITVIVPTGASTGLITVAVGASTATSATAFTVLSGDELIVYNAVSPGGANPKFFIQAIDVLADTKNNTVTIYDRWQNEVWKGTDYDNSSVVFTGAGSSGDLPTGTYYYRIEFTSGRKALTGFISLKR